MEALPKSIVKLIKSLQLKKYRLQEQLFLVEGAKNIQELLQSSFEIELITGTEDFFNHLKIDKEGISLYNAKAAELSRIGTFQTNNAGIAIAKIKSNSKPPEEGFKLALDKVGDPGNLGTIIRTADWFGFHQIIASHDSVDFYNPKVINATMGSFSRVNVYYCDLKDYLLDYRGQVWAADMDGQSLASAEFQSNDLVIMGSESHGISEEIHALQPKKITIPSFGRAESLNVAIASSVIMYEARSKMK